MENYTPYNGLHKLLDDMESLVAADKAKGFNPNTATPGLENYLTNIQQNEYNQECQLIDYYQPKNCYFPFMTNYRNNSFSLSDDKASHNYIRDDKGQIITNFKVDILEVEENENGQQQVNFRVTYANGESSDKKLLVGEFRKGYWYSDDINCHCEKITKFQEYLERLCKSKIYTIIKTVPSPGWYDLDGKLNYYSYCGNVLGTAKKIKITQEACKIFKTDVSDYQLAQDFWHMKELTSGPQASIIMAYLAMSVLYTPFKKAGLVPKGLLAVIGPQSSLKTSLVMVMVKLYKRGNGMSPHYTMKSTPASIDEGLELYKDAVMIIDDLMPSEDRTQKKELEKTLEYVVRIFGDATTKKRSKHYDKERRAEGLAVITGEYISGVASSLSRMLILNIDKNTVISDRLSFYQTNLDILPGFLWNFLQYFAKHQDKFIHFITDESNIKRKQYQSLYNIGRMADFRIELEIAMDILLQYLQCIGILNNEKLFVQKQYFSQSIDEVIRQNESKQREKQPFEQIRMTINNLIALGTEFCSNVKDGQKAQNYYDESYFYFYPEWLLKQIKDYTAKQGEVTAIDKVSYLKTVLENEGALKTITEKKGVVRRTLKIPNSSKIGDNSRFLCVPIEKIINSNSF